MGTQIQFIILIIFIYYKMLINYNVLQSKNNECHSESIHPSENAFFKFKATK